MVKKYKKDDRIDNDVKLDTRRAAVKVRGVVKRVDRQRDMMTVIADDGTEYMFPFDAIIENVVVPTE